jgi:hypothetical protein
MAKGNGKVTFALVGQQLDIFMKDDKEWKRAMIEHISALSDKVDDLRIEGGANKEKFKKLDGLERRINGMGAFGIVGAIIAGFLGVFLDPRK